MLIEAGDRVLPSFPASLSHTARDSLVALGVEGITGAAVIGCTARDVTVGDERIAAGTILWAAGVMASPAALWPGGRADAARRLEEAHALLEEISTLLSQLRRELLGGGRQR
jgi:NADH dehydrogenase